MEVSILFDIYTYCLSTLYDRYTTCCLSLASKLLCELVNKCGFYNVSLPHINKGSQGPVPYISCQTAPALRQRKCIFMSPVLDAAGKQENPKKNLWKQVWTGWKPNACTAPEPGIEPWLSGLQCWGRNAMPPALFYHLGFKFGSKNYTVDLIHMNDYDVAKISK